MYIYLMEYCRVVLFVEKNKENRIIIVLKLDFYMNTKMEQMINLEKMSPIKLQELKTSFYDEQK